MILFSIFRMTTRRLADGVDKVVLLFVVGSVFLPCSTAFAETSLKKLVFEDCQAAAEQLERLAEIQKNEFIAYLGRVLKMQAGAPSEVIFDASLVNPISNQSVPGVDPVHGQNIWRIFEPSREIEAKRCATQLLKQTAPLAFQVLPDIIDVVDDLHLPGDLRDSMVQVTWAIVAVAKASPQTAEKNAILLRLVEKLSDESSGYLAGNILAELHSQSLSLLMNELLSPDAKRREAVYSLLLRIDHEGDILGPVLIPLLDSADDSLRQKVISLLGELPQFASRAVPVLIAKFGEISSETDRALWKALESLSHEEISISTLGEVPHLQEVLLRELQKPELQRRDAIEKVLFVLSKSVPLPFSSVETLFDSNDDDLRLRAVRLAERLKYCLAADASKAWDFFNRGLYDRALNVREESVLALSKFPGKGEEVASAYLRVLKAVSTGKDSRARDRLILAVAQALIGLQPSSSGERFLPYFIDALALEPISVEESPQRNSQESEDGVIKAFQAIGRGAAVPLVKALKSDSALVRNRALLAIRRIAPEDKQIGKAVLPYLQDPDERVRQAVREYVVSSGMTLLPDLEKALRWKDPVGQQAAAEVLLSLGSSDPNIISILRNAFSAASCAEKIRLIEPLRKADESFREKVQPFLIDCLGQNNVEVLNVLSALQAVLPLASEQQRQLVALLAEGKVGNSEEIKILEKASLLGIPAADIVQLSLRLLGRPEALLRLRSINILASLGHEAAAAVPSLRVLSEDKDQDPTIRNRAVLALNSIDSEAFDARKFFIHELDGERYQLALQVLRDARSEFAAPVLQAAFQGVSSEKKPAVISFMGRFPDQGIQLKPVLIAAANEGEPQLRFQATLALLRIDPLASEVLPALRRELIGRFGAQLLSEKLPLTISDILKQILSSPNSFVEAQAAKRLLKKLESGNEAR